MKEIYMTRMREVITLHWRKEKLQFCIGYIGSVKKLRDPPS